MMIILSKGFYGNILLILVGYKKNIFQTADYVSYLGTILIMNVR